MKGSDSPARSDRIEKGTNEICLASSTPNLALGAVNRPASGGAARPHRPG